MVTRYLDSREEGSHSGEEVGVPGEVELEVLEQVVDTNVGAEELPEEERLAEESEEDTTFYGFESEPDTPDADDVADLPGSDVDGDTLETDASSDSEETEDGEPVRRSTRDRKQRQVFSYEELGGNPSFTGVT